MSVRDIQSELKEEYRVDVSEGLINEVTNESMADVSRRIYLGQEEVGFFEASIRR